MRDRRYDRRSLTSVLFSMAIEGCRKLSMATGTQCSRHPPYPTRKGYLPSPIPYLLSPISIIALRGAPSGATRQAMIGNAWHAPLPLLLQSPFAKAPALYLFILAAVVGLAVFRHLRRVAVQMTEIIDNRCGGNGKRGTENGGAAKPQKYLLSVIYYLLSIICRRRRPHPSPHLCLSAPLLLA